MPVVATSTLAILGTKAAIAVTKAGIGAVQQATKDAAESVISYVASGEYVAPDYAQKMLDRIQSDTSLAKKLVEACNDDIKRKGLPKFTDAYKRRGNMTVGVVGAWAASAGVPEYEQLLLKARIYERFANNGKAKQLRDDAEYEKLGYKGYFVTGKLDSPLSDMATETGGGDKKTLYIGLAAAAVLVLVLMRD